MIFNKFPSALLTVVILAFAIIEFNLKTRNNLQYPNTLKSPQRLVNILVLKRDSESM